MAMIDQGRHLIGRYDLRYIIKISFLFRCRTNERNVRSARKSEQRGASTASLKLRSNGTKGVPTRRVTDQAPSQETRNLREEAIPKSIARVLDASRIRSEWKQSLGKRNRRDVESDAAADSQRKSRKKVKTKGSDAAVPSDDPKVPPMRIQPGESLTHFNKLSIRRLFESIP